MPAGLSCGHRAGRDRALRGSRDLGTVWEAPTADLIGDFSPLLSSRATGLGGGNLDLFRSMPLFFPHSVLFIINSGKFSRTYRRWVLLQSFHQGGL